MQQLEGKHCLGNVSAGHGLFILLLLLFSPVTKLKSELDAVGGASLPEERAYLW